MIYTYILLEVKYMDKIEPLTSLNHNVSIIDRKNIIITGVKKIESFNDKEFLLETTMGFMTIKVDTYQGNVSIKGIISSLIYSENTKKEESLLSKLFK